MPPKVLKITTMRFLRKYQYLLLFLAVLVCGDILVLRQYQARDAAHIQRREDFLLLHERGEAQAEQRLYQALVEELPQLSDRLIADDLQRTAMLVDAKKPEPNNLLWKFHVSAGKELRHRAEQRVVPLLQAAEQ
jgi:hypothetical protein